MEEIKGENKKKDSKQDEKVRKNERKKIALWNRPCAEGSARVK